MTTNNNCNIQQTEEEDNVELKQAILLNWVNQFQTVSSLNDLTNISTLTLFLKKLFNLKSIEQETLFSQITFQTTITLPLEFNFSAFLNGDQNQILILLGFIQTQYQYYTIHDLILNNRQLSFTYYVTSTKKNTCILYIFIKHLQIGSTIYTLQSTQ
jgi:hypothetical protein